MKYPLGDNRVFKNIAFIEEVDQKSESGTWSLDMVA
jgi:hypothetical protein